MIYRIQRDWCTLVDILLDPKTKETPAARARKELRESLLAVEPIFSEMPFFMSEEFTLVDCCSCSESSGVCQRWGLKLPKQGKSILEYAERLFERESFREGCLSLKKKCVSNLAGGVKSLSGD